MTITHKVDHQINSENLCGYGALFADISKTLLDNNPTVLHNVDKALSDNMVVESCAYSRTDFPKITAIITPDNLSDEDKAKDSSHPDDNEGDSSLLLSGTISSENVCIPLCWNFLLFQSYQIFFFRSVSYYSCRHFSSFLLSPSPSPSFHFHFFPMLHLCSVPRLCGLFLDIVFLGKCN